MDDLIRSVGEATGQDRQLDAAVFGALRGWDLSHEDGGIFHFSGGVSVAETDIPPYTASLDAVLSIWPVRPSMISTEPRLALADALRIRFDVDPDRASREAPGSNIGTDRAASGITGPCGRIDAMDVLIWIGGGAIFTPTVMAMLSIWLTGSSQAVTPPLQIAGGVAGITLGLFLMLTERRHRPDEPPDEMRAK